MPQGPGTSPSHPAHEELGTLAFSAMSMGYLVRRTTLLEWVFFAVATVLCYVPGLATDLMGIAMVAGLWWWQRRKNRREGRGLEGPRSGGADGGGPPRRSGRAPPPRAAAAERRRQDVLPQVKTILYCTQLGPRAGLIFRYAYLLAEKLDARIVALHVVETLSADQEVRVERYVGAGTIGALSEREERDAAAELERRVRLFCRQEVGAEACDARVERVLVAEGQAAPQILKHVQELGADLVVMGAHSRSPVMKAVLGSTAQKVVRGSPVPVLLVRLPEDQ